MRRPHDPRGRAPRRQHDEEWKDEPQQDELEIHDALNSWARWCDRTGRTGGKCMSIEGRYNPKSDQGRGADFRLQLRPTMPPRQPNDPLCERVNAALVGLPGEYRQALTLRYHGRLPDFAMCRITCMRPHQYLVMIRAARLALAAVVFPQDARQAA